MAIEGEPAIDAAAADDDVEDIALLPHRHHSGGYMIQQRSGGRRLCGVFAAVILGCLILLSTMIAPDTAGESSSSSQVEAARPERYGILGAAECATLAHLLPHVKNTSSKQIREHHPSERSQLAHQISATKSMLERLCPRQEEGGATAAPDMNVIMHFGDNAGVVLSHNECVAVVVLLGGLDYTQTAEYDVAHAGNKGGGHHKMYWRVLNGLKMSLCAKLLAEQTKFVFDDGTKVQFDAERYGILGPAECSTIAHLLQHWEEKLAHGQAVANQVSATKSMLERLCPRQEEGGATAEPDMDVLMKLGTNSGVVLSHNECVAVNGFVAGLGYTQTAAYDAAHADKQGGGHHKMYWRVLNGMRMGLCTKLLAGSAKFVFDDGTKVSQVYRG